MSCRRDCAVQALFSFLRGYPNGVRECRHRRLWKLLRDIDGFYVVVRWSRWRQCWVACLVETVIRTE